METFISARKHLPPKPCSSSHVPAHKCIFCTGNCLPFSEAEESHSISTHLASGANIDLQDGEWNADGCPGSGVDRSGQSDAAHDALRRNLDHWDEEKQNQKINLLPNHGHVEHVPSLPAYWNSSRPQTARTALLCPE